MRTREKAIAAYTWLRVSRIAAEMDCTPQKVINMIRAGEFGAGNVMRWGREYRVRPEAFEAYKERNLIVADGARP